jgi:hypothetical protein
MKNRFKEKNRLKNLGTVFLFNLSNSTKTYLTKTICLLSIFLPSTSKV